MLGVAAGVDFGGGEEDAGAELIAIAELVAGHQVTVSVIVTWHVAISDDSVLPAAARARTARAAIERSVRMF